MKNTKSSQTTLLTSMTDTTNGLVAQYNAESDIQAQMGSAYIGLLSSIEPPCQVATNIAITTLNRMVFRDVPQISQNLQSLNITASIQELIRQMKLSMSSVLAMTIGATPSAFVGTGNGVINASTKRPFDGLVLENSYAESLVFTCKQDSYSGGAIAGNEGFSVTGVGNQQDVFAFNWPLGSNSQTTVNAINGESDNSGGNILTNSDFQDWTTNIPDHYSLIVGVAGTNISEENSIFYTGAHSLKITGDGGGTLTQIRQTFDLAAGTQGTLSAQTQYSFNLFIRRDSATVLAGVLTIDLYDGSAVIKDAAGNDNTFNITLNGTTTSFVGYSGSFRLPVIMPSTYYIRYRLSTALTNARSVYIGKSSLGLMTQQYVSGPFVAVHSGSANFVAGDYGSCAITNSRGSGGSLSTFQTLFSQLLPMQQNEFLLPSSGSPTISDALIG